MKKRLEGVEGFLEGLRQSVFAAATSGELTEQWRNGENTDSWKTVRAEEICDKVQSGGTPKEGFVDKAGIPFLKVYNIVNQKIDFEYRPQFISEEVHNGKSSKSRLLPRDVVMNIVGPPLGKVAVVPNTYPGWNMNQAITLFRPNERILTEWLYINLCGGENIRKIIHETRGSAGQSNISLTQCRNFSFPLPSTEEQKEIVRRVEHLFAFADRLEARYQEVTKQVERLTPALLEKAFRGELVAQDPDDEPAAALLERIRAVRAAQPKKAKKKATRRKSVKAKPVKTLNELSDVLERLGGEALPDRLLAESVLGDDIDFFFELLREGRNEGILDVPVGEAAPIRKLVHAN